MAKMQQIAQGPISLLNGYEHAHMIDTWIFLEAICQIFEIRKQTVEFFYGGFKFKDSSRHSLYQVDDYQNGLSLICFWIILFKK